MRKEPLVSVIVACYNAEDYLRGCIESILRQTYSSFEILICDDCSSDGSAEIIKTLMKQDSRIKGIFNKKNMRAAGARNRCIRACSGKYLMIQDADDFSRPERMEKLVGFLESHQNVDFVSTSMGAFENNPEQIFQILGFRKRNPGKVDFLWNIPFNHPAAMFRRKCVEQAGGYRVTWYTKRMEDYDLFFRLYAAGYRGWNLSEPMYLYRLDKDNYKRRTFASRIEEILVRYEGYKVLGILPIGVLFLMKPLAAYVMQKVMMFCRDFVQDKRIR